MDSCRQHEKRDCAQAALFLSPFFTWRKRASIDWNTYYVTGLSDILRYYMIYNIARS